MVRAASLLLIFVLGAAAQSSINGIPNQGLGNFNLPTNNSAIAATKTLALSETEAFNNTIIGSAVDASGNPNFLGTAGNTVLPINGGTTNLVLYIKGALQILNSNVTLTLPVTASVQQWILAVQDTTNANMVAGDFLGMNTPPFYGYVAPTCPSPTPALSATNPAFWFDLSTSLAKTCTTNAGAYTAFPSIVIGVVNINATPAINAAVAEPFRLNPLRRMEYFGTGADGALVVTAGSTTIDVAKNYSSVVITGGSLIHTANTSSFGIVIASQNPILVVGGSISATGKGRGVATGVTGVGAAGSSGTFAGSGAGGGGNGTTANSGGVGGSHFGPMITSSGFLGGAAGTSSPGVVGGNGTDANSPAPRFLDYFTCIGASGGSGAGDGTNTGGSSGAGGGMIIIRAPAIYAASGTSITSNGNIGSNGAGGNAGGGGGGGGGCNILNAGYISISGATVTASGGLGGTHAGTGADGGVGGAGILEQNKLW